MLEDGIAYSMVACAALYATWRLLPGTLRCTLTEHGAAVARGMGLLKADVDGTQRRARAATSSGCGGCSGCANNQAPRQVLFIRKKDSWHD